MASYFQNSPNLFDRRFADLRKKDPNAQTLYLYQDRCRHRNSEGFFWLPLSYVTADIGMDLHEVESAMRVLEEARYISFDYQNDVLLDRLALKFFRPSGDKQIKGAVRVFAQVPESPLKIEFLRLAYLYAKDFADCIVEACPELAEPALAGNPIDGVSERTDRPSANPGQKNVSSSDEGVSKVYPEPQIPRDELRARAKHLRDELSAQVAPEDESEDYDPVAHLRSELGAEVWRGGTR